MKKTTILMTFAILLIVTTGAAEAMNQGPDGSTESWRGETGKGPHPGDILVRAMERLDLSRDQKSEIARRLKAERKAMHAMRESLRADMRTMRQAQFKGDVETVRSLNEKLADRKQDMNVKRANFMAGIRTILNSEQLAKLDEMHQNFTEHRARKRNGPKLTMDSWILDNL